MAVTIPVADTPSMAAGDQPGISQGMMNSETVLNALRMIRWLAFAGLLSGASALGAATPGADDSRVETLRAHLADKYPQLEVDSIRPTPVEGLYEVIAGAEVHYLSAEGRYLLRGSLIDLQEQRDLTAERREGLAHAAVEDVAEERMLIYEPTEGPAEYEITVFTDTSCQYCRRLHQELMQMIQQYPVRLRYLLHPRAGPDSDAADTMRDVWCAPDPQAAMTAAKRGQSVPARADGCDTPMAEHLALAKRIGVSGTPYVLIGKDGPVFPGYRQPEALRSMLGVGE